MDAQSRKTRAIQRHQDRGEMFLTAEDEKEAR